MLLKTHFSIGLLAFAILITKSITIPFLGTLAVPTVAATIFYLFGLMVPDIDSPHSKISRHSPFAHHITSVFTKHRGLVHSFTTGLLAMFIMAAFLTKLDLNLMLAGWFFIGYAVHLLTDALTPHGVRPFWPFSNHTFRGPITTGSFSEKVISVISYSAGMILIVQSYTNLI